MSGLDWFVLIGSTAIIVFYGIWKTRKNKNIDAYLLSGHSSHWWTIGLSVMATQASAITFYQPLDKRMLMDWGLSNFILACRLR